MVLRNLGCAHFQAKEYPEAAAKFTQALTITGFQPSEFINLFFRHVLFFDIFALILIFLLCMQV